MYKNLRRTIPAVLVLMVQVTANAFQPIDVFQLPKQQFDSVGRSGNIEYFEKIGTVQLSSGEQLPIALLFDSSSEINSPFLGVGWSFLLADSYAVSADKDRISAVMANGQCVEFYATKIANQYIAEDGSIAVQDGDKIEVSSPSGYKSIFTKGRLTSIITRLGCRVDIGRPSPGVLSIVSNGSSILTIETSTKANTKILTYGLNKVEFLTDGSPRVELGPKNINSVVALIPRLSQIRFADGTIRFFRFSIDTTKIVPTLSIEENKTIKRNFEWNPANRFITRDGDYQFEIQPKEQPWQSAHITRLGPDGKTMSWFCDNLKGVETKTREDGSKVTRYWFSSGLLRGLVRKTVITDSLGKSREIINAYDDSGILLRSITKNN